MAVVELDHYQTIVNVHWPDDGDPNDIMYITTPIRLQWMATSGASNGGDDGFEYPPVPSSLYTSTWARTSTIRVPSYGNPIPYYNEFSGFNADGELVLINLDDVTAEKPELPSEASYGERAIAVILTDNQFSWKTPSGGSHSVFPSFNLGTGVARFTTNVLDGAATKYWPLTGDRTSYYEYSLSGADTSVHETDVTCQSVTYNGYTFSPVAVQLESFDDQFGVHTLSCRTLLQRN